MMRTATIDSKQISSEWRTLPTEEVVHHQRGVREMFLEGGPVPGGGVQRRQPDLVTPVDASVGEPPAQDVSGAALDHI